MFVSLEHGEGGTGLSEIAAQAHAATAAFALAAAVEEWQMGYRSLAEQLSVDTGVSVNTARELIRVGEALRDLPTIRAAALNGELSFDKVRWLTRVATPADEEHWCEFALYVTGSQLVRVVNDVRRAFDGVLTIEQCLDPKRAQPARGHPPRATGDPKSLDGSSFRDYNWVAQAMYEVSERGRAGP